MDEGRYSRNEALFGPQGQERIEAASVLIVGLGGLGSAVAQQLAYLGIRRFVLVDEDVVSLSNLNRLIGAHEADVDVTPKVTVAERMIRAIQPTAHVQPMPEKLGPTTNQSLVDDADVVFGCLDRDGPRLRLTQMSAEGRTPYLDLASDTGGFGSEAWFGGRIVLADGSGCLSCLGLLDQDQMARDAMDVGQAAALGDLYGMDGDSFDETGPAIVSVNSAVASIAVTEFMKLTAGVGQPALQLTYRGDLQSILRSVDTPAPGCWYCSLWSAGNG